MYLKASRRTPIFFELCGPRPRARAKRGIYVFVKQKNHFQKPRTGIIMPALANTYTQIYIQIVFAVEGRQNLIQPKHNDELQKYITGIVSGQKQKLLAINNMPDHVHLLVGLNAALSLSERVRDIKANSSRFVNEKRWVGGRFSWQEGFGAFSYSRSQIDSVIRYILNQQRHHARRTFRE